MNEDKALQIIATHIREDAEEVCLAAVNRLPARIKVIGLCVLGKDSKGAKPDFTDFEAYRKARLLVLSSIDNLSRKDRTRLIRIFVPSMASEVESTYQFYKTLPLNSGYDDSMLYRTMSSDDSAVNNATDWLIRFLSGASKIDSDVMSPVWIATWSAYIEWKPRLGAEITAPLMAACIDQGGTTGTAVFDILRQSVTREHDIAGMGTHVPMALLMANDPQGWAIVEGLLLAAQRQEGLRSTVLEALPYAHPAAFLKMLKVIQDNRLGRFAAVTNAINAWIGFRWDSVNPGVIKRILGALIEFLETGVPDSIWKGDNGESAYLALWSVGINDVQSALLKAEKLIKHASPTMRYAAVHYLGNIGGAAARFVLSNAIADTDERVRACAIQFYGSHGYNECVTTVDSTNSADTFKILESLLPSAPVKPHKLKSILWPWIIPKLSRETVSQALIMSAENLAPGLLVAQLKQLAPESRHHALQLLIGQQHWDADTRQAIVTAIGDASETIRATAIEAFEHLELTPNEFETLEGFLTRKTNGLRDSIMNLLMKHADDRILESAERLLPSKTGMQRLAGLELLRRLAEVDRVRSRCVGLAELWQADRNTISREESVQLGAIKDSEQDVITLDNSLGLSDPSQRASVVKPRKRSVNYITPKSIKFLQQLDALVHKHRESEVVLTDWQGTRETTTAGSAVFSAPRIDKPIKDELNRLPLADIWIDWLQSRPAALRDTDGHELTRAAVLTPPHANWGLGRSWNWASDNPDRKKMLQSVFGTTMELEHYRGTVNSLMPWFLAIEPDESLSGFLLDASENLLAMVPEADIDSLSNPLKTAWGEVDDWRIINIWAINAWLTPLQNVKKLSAAQKKRRYEILRWLQQPIPEATCHDMEFRFLVEGYEENAATFADICRHILGPDSCEYGSFRTLSSLTQRKPGSQTRKLFANHPEIETFVEQARNRIVEIELQRGEKETAATKPASSLGAVFGVDLLVRLLTELGNAGFKKEASWSAKSISKPVSLTSLATVCYPAADDDPERFTKQVKQAVEAKLFPEERVLQLAFLAPQWILHVEDYFKWTGAREAFYWFFAHMKYIWGGVDDATVGTEFDEVVPNNESGEEEDDYFSREPRLSPWERLILQRTSLTEVQRYEGRVDVQWFEETRVAVSDKRWNAIADAARFASTPAQAKRASYIADVLMGRADRNELIEQIRKRKLKENVRLLGLMPLWKGSKRNKDIHERFEILQEYRAYAKTLSGLTKPEAMAACDIGFDNLARTAGFLDPLRLEWALGAPATKDLKKGFVEVESDGVTQRMDIDEHCRAALTISRGDKPLKTLPSSHKKNADMLALRERAREINTRSSRSRQSLERAMCRADEISGKELQVLSQHYLLWPLLSRLVLISDKQLGYPDNNGKVLRDFNGEAIPVAAKDTLRIAHPCDLLMSGNWSAFQTECFEAQRIQPFKQLFRELYVPTHQERKDKTQSSRYAGQQINPRQATALWGSRGWHSQDDIWKAFPGTGISVSVEIDHAAESLNGIAGLTLNAISFYQRDANKLVELTNVDRVLFSEVMRDIDLVVSVAHQGEVDPEASASSVEMRTTLINETCNLLGIGNVKTRGTHAFIKGSFGEYSLHLGSGLIHRMPGGQVCVVPAHEQHRGRLFLPFADDDPKSAEIMSKVLMLARDDELLDPTILDQLRSKRE